MRDHLFTSGFTHIERMMVVAIIANPAAVIIRQYFCGIKIARAPSVVGHFRIAAGALAAAYATADSGLACNT
jgi:Tfp pilus assembly protein PilE